MSDNYSVTVKIQPTSLDSAGGDVGHAFITFHVPGKQDITVGFYPKETSAYNLGIVRDDSVSNWDKPNSPTVSPHDYTSSFTFIVNEHQMSNMLTYAADIANNPSDMYNGASGLPVLVSPGLGLLVGSGSNVCTDYARKAEFLNVSQGVCSVTSAFGIHHTISNDAVGVTEFGNAVIGIAA